MRKGDWCGIVFMCTLALACIFGITWSACMITQDKQILSSSPYVCHYIDHCTIEIYNSNNTKVPIGTCHRCDTYPHHPLGWYDCKLKDGCPYEQHEMAVPVLLLSGMILILVLVTTPCHIVHVIDRRYYLPINN